MNETNQEIKTLRRLSFFAAILFVSVLTLHNVATIYHGNVDEFSFGLDFFLPLCALIFLLLLALLCIPIMLAKGLFLKVYAVFLAFFALMTWIYGNLVLVYFGLLDGMPLNFEPWEAQAPYEKTVVFLGWILVSMAVYFKPRAVMLFFFFLNLGVTIPSIYYFMVDKKTSSVEPDPGLERIYIFSDTKNVIIVLMDAFQSDMFAELLAHDPGIGKKLYGFVYFPDTLGVGTTTYLTMPSIHSGKIYEAGTSVKSFYHRNVVEGSFLAQLATHGYEVALINPIQQACPLGLTICTGFSHLWWGKGAALLGQTIKLLDISLFRSVPLQYRRLLYRDYQLILGRTVRNSLVIPGSFPSTILAHNAFLETLGERAVVGTNRPVVKFIHLFSTHRPHLLREDCQSFGNQEPLEPREAALAQYRCAMTSFLKLVSSLKEKGIYDDSLIVLFSDTGEGFWAEVNDGQTKENISLQYRIDRSNPVFLIKNPNTPGNFRISYSTIQNSDLAATICAILQDCSALGGFNVFSQDKTRSKTRLYNYYWFRDAQWKRDVVEKITRYEVRGPLRDPASWKVKPFR